MNAFDMLAEALDQTDAALNRPMWCSTCRLKKQVRDFWPCRTDPSGYQRSCKACNVTQRRKLADRRAESARQWRADNPGKSAAASRRWREQNPEAVREASRRCYERKKAKRNET